MSNPLPIVALIGPTNAGKSSLLNRLAGQKVAIVAREEGTTRDSVSVVIDGRFRLIDTAGLKKPADDFELTIREQIEDAVTVADVIILTLDGTQYFSPEVKRMAKTALRSEKPVFLALNKCDLRNTLPDAEFRGLGLPPERFVRTAATTGTGVEELKKRVLAVLTPKSGAIVAKTAEITTDADLKIALIGRPNVGKSSLFNALAGKQQALVSARQGTTRDINRVRLRYHGETLEILDTAGLRRPGRREVGIEKFSALRALMAIAEADVCALLIDTTEPHVKLDQTLAGQIVEAGKGIIVVLTKTDLLEAGALDEIIAGLERDFNFVPFAPLLFTSSLTGKNVTELFKLATQIDANRRQTIPTPELNRILSEAVAEHPPAGLKNTKPRLKYIVQTDVAPPWFVIHGHALGTLHWSYKRFLERKIREKFPFIGTPLKFSWRSDGGGRDKAHSPDVKRQKHAEKPHESGGARNTGTKRRKNGFVPTQKSHQVTLTAPRKHGKADAIAGKSPKPTPSHLNPAQLTKAQPGG